MKIKMKITIFIILIVLLISVYFIFINNKKITKEQTTSIPTTSIPTTISIPLFTNAPSIDIEINNITNAPSMNNDIINKTNSIISIGVFSAIISNNILYTTGLNKYGQLGFNHTLNINIFTKVPDVLDGFINNEIKMVSTCANTMGIVTTAGTLYMCGYNYYGALGTNDTIDKKIPILITTGLENVNIHTVSCASTHTVVLGKNQKLYVCGSNQHGQLGLGFDESTTSDSTQLTTFREVTSITSVQAVSINNEITCIIKENKLYVCGKNENNLFGLGNSIIQNIFTVVPNIPSIKMVSCGSTHIGVITTDTRIYTNGINNYGQLGIGTQENTTTFTQIFDKDDFYNRNIIYISCSGLNTLILNDSKQLFGCGYNGQGISSQGILGLTDRTDTLSKLFPVLLPTIGKPDIISSGNASYGYINDIPELIMVGSNNVGQLGIGNYNVGPFSGTKAILTVLPIEQTYSPNETTPIPISTAEFITNKFNQFSISSSSFIIRSGKLYACGNNTYGQLGFNISSPLFSFIQVPNVINGFTNSNVTNIRSTGHTAIIADGKVYTCGLNDKGQLGLEDTINKHVFILVLSGVETNDDQFINEDVNMISVGTQHTLILKGGIVYGMGNNSVNQLGLPTTTSQISRVTKLSNITGIEMIESSAHNSFFLKDGDVYAVGKNNYGLLGLNTINTINTFTKIQNIPKMKTISCGGTNTFFLTEAGTVYSCGSNEQGQLGINSADLYKAYPTKLPNVSNFINEFVTNISCGYTHTLLLKSTKVNGNIMDVYGTGYNYYYNLGLGHTNTDKKVFPINLNINNISYISAGYNSSGIITNENKIYVFGDNSNGNLGLGFKGQSLLHTNAPNGIPIPTETLLHNKNLPDLLLPNSTLTYPPLSTPTPTPTPTLIPNSDLIKYSGKFNVMSLTSVILNNKLYIGSYINTEDHNMTYPQIYKPLLDIFNNVIMVSSSYNSNTHALITSTGKLYVFGINTFGQLGLQDKIDRNYYVQVTKVKQNDTIINIPMIKMVSCGEYFIVILDIVGNVYGTGNNAGHRYGFEDISDKIIFTRLSINPEIKFIECGVVNTFFITTTNDLYGCGDNNYGQLGIESSGAVIPTKITENVLMVSNAFQHTAIIKTDYKVYTTGMNASGQLGLNDVFDSTIAGHLYYERGFQLMYGYSMNGNIDIKMVKCGYKHTIVLKNNGMVFVCGSNQFGQLGINSTDTTKRSPTYLNYSFSGGNVSLIANMYNRSGLMTENNNIYVFGEKVIGNQNASSPQLFNFL
jgi:alpha-tubulin suppressor-like RCC1 family protein